MADRKISDLTALTTPASGDFLPIVDISEAAAASKNKRITIEELFRGVPLGTAAAPSIAIEGDEDTGVFSPGANQLAVATNGTGRLFVDASGKIYCNSTAGSRLEIVNSTNTGGGGENLHSYTSGYYIWGIRNESNALALESNFDGAIIFKASNNNVASSPGTATEKVRITSAGLVGVGTSAPSNTAGFNQQLQLSGNLPCISIDNTGTGANKYSLGVNGVGALGVWDNTASAFRMYINSAGLVGIGNSSPNTALDVNGVINVRTNGFEFGRITTNNVSGIDGGLSFQTILGGAFSTKMVLDAAGRLGIGTTSPATPLDVRSAGTGDKVYVFNASDLTTGLVLGNGSDHAYLDTGTQARLAFKTNGTEKARIDSSGRLLVGTSTSAGNAKLQVIGDSAASTNPGRVRVGTAYAASAFSNPTELGRVEFGPVDDVVAASISSWYDVTGSGSVSDFPGRLVFSTTADGASSPTERMRITSGGAMWLNTTTGTVGTTAFGTVFASDGVGSFRTSRNVDGVDHVAIVSGNVGIFVVRGDGDCENTNNSYGALSDVKLKENIVNASSQWNDISALQVRNYNFKTETGYRNHTQIGLIAQEVELVSPGLVSESPDRDEDGNDLGTVTKSVNYSVLYMKAVKALQEAMERIEVLEQRLNDAGIN
jgi:hypothetical protein